MISSSNSLDFPLKLLNPSFDSELVDVLNDLEKLRHWHGFRAEIPANLGQQLQSIFHMLESLGSARIEGNHTTLSDYVESRLAPELAGHSNPEEELAEIINLEKAMAYIDKTVEKDSPLTEQFIRELHQLAVWNLKREGADTPGRYRQGAVRIAQSQHCPPPALKVPDYMQELLDFINRPDKPKYDLLKIAQAHHRFVWIHPFDNGNGRTVRLLTYALLIKYGFRVASSGRLLNPTAVFCNDRQCYYQMLELANRGTREDREEDLERWCVYVLGGIQRELSKLDLLLQRDFLHSRILLLALGRARERQQITAAEEKILRFLLEHDEMKAGDLKNLLPQLNDNQRSYQMKKLLDNQLISLLPGKSRIYGLELVRSPLLRGITAALEVEGFVGRLNEREF